MRGPSKFKVRENGTKSFGRLVEEDALKGPVEVSKRMEGQKGESGKTAYGQGRKKQRLSVSPRNLLD